MKPRHDDGVFYNAPNTVVGHWWSTTQSAVEINSLGLPCHRQPYYVFIYHAKLQV